MNYYKLRNSVDEKYCNSQGVVDLEERPIDVLMGEHGRTFGYVPADEVTIGRLLLRRRGEIADKVDSPDAYLLFSGRTMEALKLLAWFKGIRTFPLKVCKGSKETPLAFSFVYSNETVDAINYEKSQFEYFLSDKTRIRRVTRFELVPTRLPDSDIFREKVGGWIVTQRLVDVVAEQNLSGFRFELVWNSLE